MVRINTNLHFKERIHGQETAYYRIVQPEAEVHVLALGVALGGDPALRGVGIVPKLRTKGRIFKVGSPLY